MRSRVDSGFTLSEVMVVVVIVGLLAAVAGPRLTRDGLAADGREFAGGLARELQRARNQAITVRLPQYAFIYADRVEIRSARRGATPAAPPIPPTVFDPVVRTIAARAGITILDVSNSATPPAQVLSTTSGKQLVWNTMGGGFLGPVQPFLPTPVYLFIENAALGRGKAESRFRIDVSGLAGGIELRSRL